MTITLIYFVFQRLIVAPRLIEARLGFVYGLNSGDTETECVWNTGTPGNEDVHVDWFHGGQLIYSSDGAKKGKCDDKETWACMELEQIGGCNRNNEKWEKAKNVCKRTCNICSSDDGMTGWIQTAAGMSVNIELKGARVSIRLSKTEDKAIPTNLNFGFIVKAGLQAYSFEWSLTRKAVGVELEMRLENCPREKTIVDIKCMEVTTPWTVNFHDESFSMFCDGEVVLQKMKYPESCEGWADLVRHSNQIEFTNFPNGLQFEVRSEELSPYTVRNIKYLDEDTNVVYRSKIHRTDLKESDDGIMLKCNFWHATSDSLHQETKELKILSATNWELKDKNCTGLNSMKVDHNEIFKCPQKTTGVFTRRFDENKCVFSAKCAGASEEDIAMQACGCRLVQSTEDNNMNTTICLNKEGEYEAVPTEILCSNSSATCLAKHSDILASTTVCEDQTQGLFSCSNGRRVRSIYKCDYNDNCNTFSDSLPGNYLAKQPLFEDEANCNHAHGVECLYKTVSIWVPPYLQKCDRQGICNNNLDGIESEDFKCTVRVNCILNNMNNTVFEGQMCDPTKGITRYCDDEALTYMNCSSKDQPDSSHLVCKYNGFNTTLDNSLECDGKQTCDNEEDEICFYSSKKREPCKLNEFRIDSQKTEDTCVSKDDEFITCPNSTYYVNKGLICNGNQDCEDEPSEEDMCPAGKAVQSLFETSDKSGIRDRKNYREFFESNCLPGISRDSHGCQKKLFNKEKIRNSNQYGVIRDCHYLSNTTNPTTLNCSGTTIPLYHFSPGNTITIHLKNVSQLQGYKTCTDTRLPIEVTEWCDTECDCQDCSDEADCSDTNPRTFQCEDRKYIPYTQFCDGQTNCKDSTDECHENCTDDSYRNILTSKYRPVAGFIGITAFLINGGSLLVHSKKLPDITAVSSFINQMLIILIALGDFLVGLYMLLVLAATIHFGDSYCPHRNKWLSSNHCSGLGVLSTTGTMISMLSMTVLSAFRMYSLKMMVSLGEATLKAKLKALVISLSIVLVSLLIAVLPVLNALSSYFVNGLILEGNPLFTGVTDRTRIEAVVKHFNPSESIKSQSWNDYEEALQNLYYLKKNFTGLTSSRPRIGFYGNQGVCLFKYFVKPDDPQVAFSMLIIGLCSVCFIIISICYLFIFSYAASSSVESGSSETQKQSMKRLQHKVTLIITTDFLTWIPFIIIALLHLSNQIDATPYYEFCSILLIPINSVINPMIYNGDKMVILLKNYYMKWKRKMVITPSSGQNTASLVVTDQIELSSIRQG